MADVMAHEAPVHQAAALPVDAPPKLIGRDTSLARVYTFLKENKTVLVYGASGVGKSAVAATLASAYTELPGGSLWLNIDLPTFPELVVRVGRAYNLSNVTRSDNPVAFVAAVASTLAREKPLIILDGRIDAATANEFVSRVASGLPTLILNDEELEGAWLKFPLNALEPTQASALFRATADLPSAPADEVSELAAALSHMPYALVIAAGHVRANKQTATDFKNALPPADGSINPSLLALTVAFRGLNGALQGLLLVLGATQRGAASAELISMIGSAPTEMIDQAMTLLVARHLVVKSARYGMPYYHLHPITHAFANSWLRGSGRLDGLQSKAREAVLAYARKYAASTPEAHDHLAAEMDNFLAMVSARAEAGDRDFGNELMTILLGAGDFFNARGYVYELVKLRESSSGMRVAFPHDTTSTGTIPAVTLDDDDDLDDEPPVTRYLPDDDDEEDEIDVEIDEQIDDQDEEDEFDQDADDFDVDDDEIPDDIPTPPLMQRSMFSPPPAPTLLPFEDEDEDLEDDIDDQDEPDEDDELTAEDEAPAPEADEVAQLRAQVVEAKQANDRKRQAERLITLAALHRARGHDNEAVAAYSEALAVLENLNDDATLLTVLTSLAELTHTSENYQAAALYAARGANLADKLEDDTQQTRLLVLLGDARQQLGESKDAARAYQRGLDVARTANDARNEALLLFKLGYAYLDDSAPNDAIESWEEALALFRKQERRDYEGRVLGGLGAAYSELERWSEAINFHTSALHIAREVKDKDEELLQLSNLGYAAVQARQLGQAVLRYRQALHLAYTNDDKPNIVGTSVDLARLLVESPRHLSIAELIIDDAMQVEPTSRDLRRLKERIEDEREALGDELPDQAPVAGSARLYAENAYAMLDQ